MLCAIKFQIRNNIFSTTNDTMIPFGLYDAETHKVLCTPSIHFNVSSVTCRTSRRYTSSCHVQLNMFAYTSVHAAVIREPKILQVCHIGVADTSLTNPHRKKISRGVMSGDCGGSGGWSVSANPATWKFHAGWLERLRPNEGEHRPVEK